MALLAVDLITPEIPPLKAKDTSRRAMDWMDEFKVSHLPVVDGRKFLGLISETDLLDLSVEDHPIGELKEPLQQSSVLEIQHIFEVVKTVSDLGLSLIPVTNQNNEYVGSITLKHLLEVIADMSIVCDPGGAIILEVNINDYSLTQIANIIESNGAKVLGMFITSHPDSTKMEVTVKVNKNEIGGILQTFSRYDYNVSGSYDVGDQDEDYQNRYDSLMKYLNM